MFWKFFLLLLAADFAVTLLFSIVYVVATTAGALLAAATKHHPRLSIAVVLAFGLFHRAVQLYFWGGWAAFCSEMTHKFSTHPSVSHHWLYWLWAFFAAYSPLAWITHRASEAADSTTEVERTRNWGFLWCLAAIVGFLVFAFWRDGAQIVYGWFLCLLQ